MQIILVVLFIAFLIAMWLINRNRVQPPGTYDSEDYRSSGSIGDEGPRAYDSPDHRSGGSIGGSNRRAGQRTYDSPDHDSGGSIGGGPKVRGRAAPPRRGSRERPEHDDEDFRSGGSTGG
jgi:hypothetical protein